jgi:hypothetical protein
MSFYTKLKGLKLHCPKCGATMTEFTNYGLFLEERWAGTIPYYCAKCKKKTLDYPIYNVTTRRNERRFLLIYGATGLIIILLGWLLGKMFI